MMMIGSDDRVRVKIVLYGINSKMADVSLTSLLLVAPQISSVILLTWTGSRTHTHRHRKPDEELLQQGRRGVEATVSRYLSTLVRTCHHYD